MTENGLNTNTVGNSFKLYDNPQYYEIAFSFRDISSEVDLFQTCIKRFSHIPVKSVLELGCGNCPHMEELVKRGYQYNGLDINQAMLKFGDEKAKRMRAEVNLIHADMRDFSLNKEFDFIFVLLGSLSVGSTAELSQHFDCVANTLKKGGLYLLDWCVQFETPWTTEGGGTWEMERDGIRVKTTVSWKPINRVEQTFEETIIQKVDDHGKKLEVIDQDVKRAILPQEFLLFISNRSDFEFVGWWNNWDFDQPLEKAEKIDRPIVLVRRK